MGDVTIAYYTASMAAGILRISYHGVEAQYEVAPLPERSTDRLVMERRIPWGQVYQVAHVRGMPASGYDRLGPWILALQ